MEGNGLKEFKAWMKQNEERLGTGYTIDDVVNMAIACGFDRSTVMAWATSQKFKEAI